MNWWVYFVLGILECLSLECVFIGLWSSHKIRKGKEMIGHTSFGYDSGFNDGYKKGRADCLREAHRFADQESYKEGYRRGLEQGRADAFNEMKDKLQLSAIYTETVNGWSGMTVDTIQIEEIANELKEQRINENNIADNTGSDT